MGEEGLRGRQEARVGARLVAFLSSSRFSKSQALLDAVPRATSPLVAVDISSGAGPAAPVPILPNTEGRVTIAALTLLPGGWCLAHEELALEGQSWCRE